jgi:ABC-type transport system substrate-binding protein
VWAHKKDDWDYSYDPDKAKQLLVEAGVADGFTLPVWMTTPPAAMMEEVVEATIRDWAAIGIESEVQKIAGPSWNGQYLTPRDWNGYWFSGGPGGAVRQPEAVRLCRLPTAAYNQGNELPDGLALCDAERAELDPVKQQEILGQNIEYFTEWKIIIPMYQQDILFAVSDNIGEWKFGTPAERILTDPEYAQHAR